jgi:hypothetical protein
MLADNHPSCNKLMRALLAMLALVGAICSASCSRQVKANYAVAYKAEPNNAVVINGRAVAPRKAPVTVKRAIAAANHIQGLPYKWGGGHARINDNGYDCSGAVSYVLRNAGLMADQMPSKGFLNYGKRGHGKWITVYVRNGHVFMVIAGLRFDTQGEFRQEGPRWRTEPRRTKGLVVRHPSGL